jgi:hypothetical protein
VQFAKHVGLVLGMNGRQDHVEFEQLGFKASDQVSYHACSICELGDWAAGVL